MPLPTIGQVLQKVDYRQCPMTQELGDAAEDIRELFPEFLSECLNASGQSMDSDYCDIELGEYGDVAHSLIFETDSTIGAVLRANADSRIDIDSIRSLESSGSVTLQDITSLLLNHIAASVANDWARAFEEAGEELEIES